MNGSGIGLHMGAQYDANGNPLPAPVFAGGAPPASPTTPANDPAALLNALMASPPGGLHMGEQYDANGNPLPAPVFAGGAPPADFDEPPPSDFDVPPPSDFDVPPNDFDEPPANGRARKHVPAGEGSVNKAARERGEMLTSFLASFQAAFQRQNPNFNFARNPKLAKSLNLPWSGDIGR